MAGRTWLQQSTPVTFGVKAAGWLDALIRQRTALAAALAGHLAKVLGQAPHLERQLARADPAHWQDVAGGL
jgi:3-carboxy-cis,cis-muconate cycloisomerase